MCVGWALEAWVLNPGGPGVTLFVSAGEQGPRGPSRTDTSRKRRLIWVKVSSALLYVNADALSVECVPDFFHIFFFLFINLMTTTKVRSVRIFFQTLQTFHPPTTTTAA